MFIFYSRMKFVENQLQSDPLLCQTPVAMEFTAFSSSACCIHAGGSLRLTLGLLFLLCIPAACGMPLAAKYRNSAVVEVQGRRTPGNHSSQQHPGPVGGAPAFHSALPSPGLASFSGAGSCWLARGDCMHPDSEFTGLMLAV